MQQEQTATPATADVPGPSVLDQLRAFARQHRDLARRNYSEFTDKYGRPTDRVKEWRERVKAGWQRARAEAREGYGKLDREILAKARGEPATVTAQPATNGAGH